MRSAELGEPPLQQPPLGVVVDELQGPAVGVAGIVLPAQAAKQLAAGGVEVAVVVELQPVDDRQRRLRPVRLGNGDRAVQLDDRRASQP